MLQKNQTEKLIRIFFFPFCLTGIVGDLCGHTCQRYTGFITCLFIHTEQGGRLRADTHTHKCHEGFSPQGLFSLQTGVVPAAQHLPGPEKEKAKSRARQWAPAPVRQSSVDAELPPAQAPGRSRFQIPPPSPLGISARWDHPAEFTFPPAPPAPRGA